MPLIKNVNGFVYKLMARGARLLGLGALYDPKLRALLVLRRAATLAAVHGAEMHELVTVAGTGYADACAYPAPTPAQAAGACGTALVQCAEVQQLGMGAAMLHQLDYN